MNLWPLLAGVLLIAFLTGSEGLFYLLYVLVGLWAIAFLWTRQALLGLAIERRFPARAFQGEEVQVEIALENQGRWPLLWLSLQEVLPIPLHVPGFVQRVVSLAAHETARLDYKLVCRRRGYYMLGPLNLRTGDFVSLRPDREMMFRAAPFIVYPRVVPLRDLGLPSNIPFGNLASRQRVFEDPSRFFGVRDYTRGDSLKQIHWSSSAHAQHLLVKRFQPSVALNTLILLNLNSDEYSLRGRARATELGILVAASVAAHLVEQRQRAGLAVLGQDAVTGRVGLTRIAPGRGRDHLMRVLEALARAEAVSASPLADSVSTAASDLSWGSSLVVVAAGDSPHLLDALVQLRRRGLLVMFAATDAETNFPPLKDRLTQIGIPAFLMSGEEDLDVWP